jgi:hypothetical protein
MTMAFLIAIGVGVCVTVQLLARRYWFALFLGIVATMIAWVLVAPGFAFATARPIFGTGEWSILEAVLGAALIAQIVALFLRRFR